MRIFSGSQRGVRISETISILRKELNLVDNNKTEDREWKVGLKDTD